MEKRFLFFLSIGIALFIFSCEKKDTPEPEGTYTKTIQRNFSGSFEKSLLEKAEAWYPPREEVLGAAGSAVEIPGTHFWFYQEFDGVYIPYAITSDAIEYYSELIGQFSQGRNDSFFSFAELIYTASVEFHESYLSPDFNSLGEPEIPQSYTSVYVVNMKLNWHQYCGPLCAMWIEKERIVVFRESGELIDVFLDGPIPVPVS